MTITSWASTLLVDVNEIIERVDLSQFQCRKYITNDDITIDDDTHEVTRNRTISSRQIEKGTQGNYKKELDTE